MFDFFDNYNCLKNKNLSFIVIQKNIFLPVYVFFYQKLLLLHPENKTTKIIKTQSYKSSIDKCNALDMQNLRIHCQPSSPVEWKNRP